MKKRVLLTGDDGYNALGTRLVSAALKDSYDLYIAGTLRQQSGVGSTMSLASGFEWGSDTVDGVPALWVDGSPADAIELATAYFKEPFDFVISGVNWGANIGAAIPASGTLGAAQRALATELAPLAFAFSWDLPVEMYRMAHNGVDELGEYLEYPGKLILPIIEKALTEDGWGAPLLNINFPKAATNQVKMTALISKLKEIYDYSVDVVDSTADAGHFEYKGKRKDTNTDETTDVGALNKGFVTISPCKFDYLNDEVHQKIQNTTFSF